MPVPADNLAVGCVVKETANVEPARPTTGRRNVAPMVPEQTQRFSDPNGEFKPIFHKKITGPMQHTDKITRRKTITEEAHAQMTNESMSSRLSNTSLTGSCRRRSASVGQQHSAGGLRTPYATTSTANESPSPAVMAAMIKAETPRSSVRRVAHPWAQDSGNFLALEHPSTGSGTSTPGGTPAVDRRLASGTPPPAAGPLLHVGKRRATSVSGATRSTDPFQPTAEVFDISMTLTTKRRLPIPGASPSLIPVFQQDARADEYRPMLRQKGAIRPVGSNELPLRARPSKRFNIGGQTTAIGAGATVAAAESSERVAEAATGGVTLPLGSSRAGSQAQPTSTPRGRKRVENHSVSEESPKIVNIWPKSGRRHLQPEEREAAKAGKRQFARTSTSPVVPSAGPA